MEQRLHVLGSYLFDRGAEHRAKYEKWLEPENLLKLEGWARDGLTEKQIASNMGIARSTLIEWKNKFSDISDT